MDKVINDVHDLFQKHCTNPQQLSNEVGRLYTIHGRDVVNHAMIECTKIAYLRLKFANNKIK